MFDVKAATDWFLDRAEVAALVDPATRQALTKFGAYVRTRARSSIRTRKAASAPGSPPSSHTGALKRFIFFSFDPTLKSVVIGPTPVGSESGAPALLEHGGSAVQAGREGGRVVTYQPRPYMQPAFDAELPRAADEFRDLIG